MNDEPHQPPAAQAVINAAYTLPLKNGQPNIAAALEWLAHWVDWESGDPKFLVLAIAAELKDINQSD